MIYTDESKMPYGQHVGKQLKDVPASYLLFIYENHDLNSTQRWGLRVYIEDNLQVLNLQAKQNVKKLTRE